MGRKRKAAARKVQMEEKKPKVVVEHKTSDEEESDPEEETEEIEELEFEEEVKEDHDDEVEVEEEDAEGEAEEKEEEEEEGEGEGEGEEEGEGEGEGEEEEEEDESSEKETLMKLLEPFPKEQIIEFLKEAALKDRSLVARLTETAQVDPAHRKIFVHGLGWDATSDLVLSIFTQYGDIEECKVVKDKVTGRAKGYGFVLFKSPRSARKALKQPQKKIGSRLTSCQLASAGPVGPSNNPKTAALDPTGRKIFVANVGSHVNPIALRAYFAKFGEIEEGPLGIDNATGMFKGFAIFVYKTVDGCKKALEEPRKVFEGCQLQCRQAVDSQHSTKNVINLPAATSNGNLQQIDIGNLTYGGFYPPNIVNPAAGIMVGQNPMLVSALNQNGISPRPQSLSFGGTLGINMVTPSVIANYGSQLGLQGLGPYQNPQVGHSSASPTTTLSARQQSGIGSLPTNFSSYLGR